MTKTSEPIVFFGSGPVAAASLAALATEFTIEAVITKQSPGHHHGPVPVNELAESLRIPINFANTRSELDILMGSSSFKSRLGVIVDYGVIVSAKVISTFPLGILNSHFSLLPQWRGADPITFSVLSGQHESGVSLMLIVEALDEGPLLSQEKLPLPPDITTPELTQKLVTLSNTMLLRDIPKYLTGELKPYDQPAIPPSYSRKLTKDDGKLHPMSETAEQLEREIRAYADWPKSRLSLGDTDIIITKASVAERSGTPGTLTAENKELFLYCSQNALRIERLKPAGKREMSASEFLLGHRL